MSDFERKMIVASLTSTLIILSFALAQLIGLVEEYKFQLDVVRARLEKTSKDVSSHDEHGVND